MNKLRWGIISTAKIGTQKVIPAMQRGRNTEVVAIASRDAGSAREAADRLGIPVSYGSYEELLEDPNIDAVYIPLPNHLHVPWTKKALEAGKHVLCEKPVALSAAEAAELAAFAKDYPELVVMEAFMYRFHPQWQQARKLVREGAIGTLCTIQSFFSYHNVDPGNIRNVPEMGGGGLMDIGCYPISLSRFLFEAEPIRVMGLLDFDPAFGTDRLASGILEFERGTATFTCGMQLSHYQKVNIFGTEGRIEIDIPFNAPPDRTTVIRLDRNFTVTEIPFDAVDQYTLQGDAFAQAVQEKREAPTPLTDAVYNMKVIDAVARSVRTAGWEVPN